MIESVLNFLQTILFWSPFALSALCFWKRLKQSGEDETDKKNLALQSAFDLAAKEIDMVTATTVGKLEQILGKDIRADVKDGKRAITDLQMLAEDAYREIVTIVQPETLDNLKKTLQDAELYIRNGIEAELVKLKAKLYK